MIDKKQITASGVCLFLVVFCLSFILFFTTKNGGNTVLTHSKPRTDWGLGFKKSGEQPTGNASASFLKKYDSYFVGSKDTKTLYLTFDAGYENGYTPKILDTLKKHNVKAAFFVVGTYLKSEPDLIRRMTEEGHIVGNHTLSHPDMSSMSNIDSFKKEISPVEDSYKKITGQDMKKFYRPPRGVFSELNLKFAKELEYKTIFWSLAYEDWKVNKQPAEGEALKKLTSRIHPGAIILLHTTSETNSKILDTFIEKTKEEGYRYSNLDNLV
ncbi:MAG: delta-lactam-biosynthetic de-N-acetylase [Oscillospiraceae bacterium]|nr:delta-lactam-biosynthetic de-N-acetylase [Oscillospiraceae bacterium]